MPVGRLATEDAQRLAEVLLARTGTAMQVAAEIASEARGHPLFIDELVRHAAMSGGEKVTDLRLDDALWQRVQSLDSEERRVLDLACVLGAPASQEVVSQAVGMGLGELAPAIARLRASSLVRTGGARASDPIEPFHDRVREAVAARLDDGRRRECHMRIAAALERAKTMDPESVATHWEGAGQPEKAVRHTLLAGEQAAQALAFMRAAALFERAIGQLPAGDARIRMAHEQLGEALANAGELHLPLSWASPARAAVADRLAVDTPSTRAGHASIEKGSRGGSRRAPSDCDSGWPGSRST
jgi:predicted ATPase